MHHPRMLGLSPRMKTLRNKIQCFHAIQRFRSPSTAFAMAKCVALRCVLFVFRDGYLEKEKFADSTKEWITKDIPALFNGLGIF